MLKKYILPVLGGLGAFGFATAKAFCPICTAAVIGGVGLSRWLKIDDAITGLWIGGVIISSAGWTVNWCKAKKINFWLRDLLIFIAFFLIVLIPLYYYDIVGHPANRLWGVDKLILGTLVGSIFFYSAGLRYEQIKKANNGKPQFPYQRVVLPLATLLVLSLAFYLITRH